MSQYRISIENFQSQISSLIDFHNKQSIQISWISLSAWDNANLLSLAYKNTSAHTQAYKMTSPARHYKKKARDTK